MSITSNFCSGKVGFRHQPIQSNRLCEWLVVTIKDNKLYKFKDNEL